jgi:hypothetical protein
VGNAPLLIGDILEIPPSSESGMSAGRVFGFPLAILLIRGFFAKTIIKESGRDYIKMYANDDTTNAKVIATIHGIVTFHAPGILRCLYISIRACNPPKAHERNNVDIATHGVSRETKNSERQSPPLPIL